MTPRLTIAIPTFDRNALLRDHVAGLLPQLTADCRLIILDNHSPTPAAETLAEVLAAHPEAPVTVVRHPLNVGSSANVMRCLELCPTRWLWTLGDDDRPLSDAVATALEMIGRYDDCVLINFASMNRAVDADTLTDGVEGFVRGIPHFANLTLISNNLVRADRLRPVARLGNFFAYSLYPHLACVLSALQADGGRCCFSPRQIVEWGPACQWSRVMAGAGMGVLLDLPVSGPVRRGLVPWLIGVSGRYSSLVIHLLDQVGVTIDSSTARHVLDQAYFRLYRLRHRPWHWAVRLAGRVMLTFPTPSKKLYRLYRYARGNPGPPKPRDELRRM